MLDFEQPPGDTPAFVLITDKVARGHDDIGEEFFAELCTTVNLLDPAEVDTVRPQIDDQHRYSLVLGHVPPSAHRTERKIGKVCAAAPCLLAVDNESIAIAMRAGQQARQIRTSAWLGKELQPQRLAGKDVRNVRELLLVSAKSDKRDT